MMEFRTPYNYDRDAVSKETGLSCEDESLAQQHLRDETDINFMLERFGATGVIARNDYTPMFGDFTEITDFRSALHAVMDAEESFMTLPAKTRERFGNDPQQLMDFVFDVNNKDEAMALGLLNLDPDSANSKNLTNQDPLPAGSGTGAT